MHACPRFNVMRFMRFFCTLSNPHFHFFRLHIMESGGGNLFQVWAHITVIAIASTPRQQLGA